MSNATGTSKRTAEQAAATAQAPNAGARAGRVPPPARRKSASDLTTTVLASVAIALPLMFYLRQHVEILKYGYEIEALEERRAGLLENSRELSIERSRAASLPEAWRRAQSLGFVAPDPRDVFAAVGEETHDSAPNGPAVPMTARLE